MNVLEASMNTQLAVVIFSAAAASVAAVIVVMRRRRRGSPDFPWKVAALA